MILSMFGFNLTSVPPESEAEQFVRSFRQSSLAIRELQRLPSNQNTFLEDLIISNNATSNETLIDIIRSLTPQEMRDCFLSQPLGNFTLFMSLAQHKRPLVKQFLQNPSFYLSLSELNSTDADRRTLCSLLLFLKACFLSADKLSALCCSDKIR